MFLVKQDVRLTVKPDINIVLHSPDFEPLKSPIAWMKGCHIVQNKDNSTTSSEPPRCRRDGRPNAEGEIQTLQRLPRDHQPDTLFLSFDASNLKISRQSMSITNVWKIGRKQDVLLLSDEELWRKLRQQIVIVVKHLLDDIPFSSFVS